MITFQKKDKVRDIVHRMFDNKTRKLVLEGTSSFINDRIIIEKLAREFNCLRDGEDFLEMNADIFSLEQARNTADNLTISDACKIMQDMKSPYLMVDGKVISSWDMILILYSERSS